MAYTLKALGYAVTASDFLSFPAVIAAAVIANQDVRLSPADIARITGPPADGRDFVQRTFKDLYFSADDRAFLDAAWSHIDQLTGEQRSLALAALILSLAALILAAARKQPRGVFTFTDLRYDDGRRNLHAPLREHFAAAAEAYNKVVFDSGAPCQVKQSDVFELDPAGYDLVYLDPPYAPPRDDNCYIKRYHFLEGLSVYWEGLTILEHTATKKLAKRYTPFSHKHRVTEALRAVFEKFADSAIVLSYSSNAVPGAQTIEGLLRAVKDSVEVRSVDHRYHFGTHSRAERRKAAEYLFIAR